MCDADPDAAENRVCSCLWRSIFGKYDGQGKIPPLWQRCQFQWQHHMSLRFRVTHYAQALRQLAEKRKDG